MLPITLFFYGFLAACASLLLQVLLLTLFGAKVSFTNPSLLLLSLAALLEEGMKLLFLIQAWRRFHGAALTLLSLIVFGLGFALVEYLLGLFLNPSDLPPLSLLTANILLHLITVLFLGLSFRRFPFPHPMLFGAFILTTLLHVLYNFVRL